MRGLRVSDNSTQDSVGCVSDGVAGTGVDRRPGRGTSGDGGTRLPSVYRRTTESVARTPLGPQGGRVRGCGPRTRGSSVCVLPDR